MAVETSPIDEYQPVVVGAAHLLTDNMKRLDVVDSIDDVLNHQPAIEIPYAALAQVIMARRMRSDAQPLYILGDWAGRHGMGRVFAIDASLPGYDLLRALLEGLADHQSLSRAP